MNNNWSGYRSTVSLRTRSELVSFAVVQGQGWKSSDFCIATEIEWELCPY